MGFMADSPRIGRSPRGPSPDWSFILDLLRPRIPRPPASARIFYMIPKTPVFIKVVREETRNDTVPYGTVRYRMG